MNYCHCFGGFFLQRGKLEALILSTSPYQSLMAQLRTKHKSQGVGLKLFCENYPYSQSRYNFILLSNHTQSHITWNNVILIFLLLYSSHTSILNHFRYQSYQPIFYIISSISILTFSYIVIHFVPFSYNFVVFLFCNSVFCTYACCRFLYMALLKSSSLADTCSIE